MCIMTATQAFTFKIYTSEKFSKVDTVNGTSETRYFAT